MSPMQRSAGNTVDNFVEIIRRKADISGVSITELAHRAGVTRPYLHRVLSRKQGPSLEKASQIAEALGLSVVVKKKQ